MDMYIYVFIDKIEIKEIILILILLHNYKFIKYKILNYKMNKIQIFYNTYKNTTMFHTGFYLGLLAIGTSIIREYTIPNDKKYEYTKKDYSKPILPI
jgi:hypothetical protein